MIRYYLAPQIVDNSLGHPVISTILYQMVNSAVGESFDEFDNPSRQISLCCVRASTATHSNIVADSRVLSVGDLANDQDDLRTKMDSLLNALSNAATLKTALEARGISTSWISGGNTVRDAVRYLLRVFFLAQLAAGDENTGIKQVIAANLDVTVNQLPLAVRNSARDWMTARGLDVGVFTSNTTMRQVLHYIQGALGMGVINIGGERF